ncbi:MAG: peptidase, partial [Peptostreptococcus sp.]|nr:peptidase [Peptostreptococcus sp.]
MIGKILTFWLILIILFVAIRCIRIVKQARMGIIMRLGKFHKEAKTGIHFLV